MRGTRAGLSSASIDEYFLYGSGGGSYDRTYGFAIDAFAPTSRDLYNYETSFYDPATFGGEFGPTGAVASVPAGSDFEETVYACPDGNGGHIISFGTPCEALTPAAPTTTQVPTTPVTPVPVTSVPQTSSANQPAWVVPALIAVVALVAFAK